MARGGKRQTYARDARGRFASTGGSKRDGALKGGTLQARSSLRRSRAKAAASPSPQQRGAVTRGSRKLAAAKVGAQQRISTSRATISKPKGLKPGRIELRTQQLAAQQTAKETIKGIRRSTQRIAAKDLERNARPGLLGQLAREGTGRGNGMSSRSRRRQATDGRTAIKRRLARAELLASRGSKPASKAMKTYRRQLAISGQEIGARPKNTVGKPKKTKPKPANKITRTPGFKAPRNAVKRFQPKTVGGLVEKARRVLKRDVSATGKPAKEIRKGLAKQSRRLSRFTARSMANRLDQGIEGRLARLELSVTDQSLKRRGLGVIRDRSARASAAAARGSKAGARAREIYATQLAGMGPGKPKRDQANTVKPGPRNTKGPPKKRPRRKRK